MLISDLKLKAAFGQPARGWMDQITSQSSHQ